MIKFNQGIDNIVTISSIDQLLTYTEGDIPTENYSTMEEHTFDEFPGKFIYPSDNMLDPGGSCPIGAKDIYSKTNTQIKINDTQFNISNLPTPFPRDTDTVIYYQPISNGVKVLVTSKTWDQGTANHTFIHDVNTLSIVLYSGTNRDIYGYSTISGSGAFWTVDAQPLDTSKMIDEADLMYQLGGLFFGKEWVMNYINDRLETVIPKAVDTAVKEAETIIQQRYVSR